MYFYECPICGCHLDPGEKCDCSLEKARFERQMQEVMEYDSKTKQYKFVALEKKVV